MSSSTDSPPYTFLPFSPPDAGLAGNDAPPNTPASDASLSPRFIRRREPLPQSSMLSVVQRLSPLNIHHEVDLRAVTYVGDVDENLICTICRCPYIDPVTTVCDHVFCRSCLKEAFDHNEICPIDRSDLDLEATLQGKTAKIILNQLDGLKAKCRGCDAEIARSMLENHMEKYCPETTMWCPGKNTERNCREQIKRKLSTQGCLHYATDCPDCHNSVLQIDMDYHREHECDERLKQCIHCNCQILSFKELEHFQECPDIVVMCRWAEYGCKHTAKRIGMGDHMDACNFTAVGHLAEMMKGQIASLSSEVRALTEKSTRQERRLRFLERGPETHREIVTDYADFSFQPLPNIPESPNEPFTPGNEYVLSILEAQDTRMGQMEATMKEIEAKQSTMFFNETLSIKHEINELRNMQQTTGMHVRWLMNFRMKENQRRTGAPGPSSDNGGGPSSDSALPRRLSDSTNRDINTKL